MSDFKRLQAKWYRKLKADGFQDIEDTNSENEYLKTWDSLYFLSRYTTDQFKAKEKYFQLATDFLENHCFDTSKEKAIWSMYAGGMSVREISKKRKVTYFKISKIIKRLERLMFGGD